MLPSLPKPQRLDLTRPFSLIWNSTHFAPTHQQPLVILDSSYNPPSKAHAALCLASLRSAPNNSQLVLLLATKNADANKSNKEESVMQRKIAMVHAMAQDLVEARQGLEVAIALVAEPYFTQKNSILKDEWPEARLSWIIGTLQRFFDPKYYPEGVEAAVSPFFATQSRILWFSRPTTDSQAMSKQEEAFLSQPQVRQFAEGLQQIPVPSEALQVSSTRARAAVKSEDQAELDLCVSARVQEIVKSEGLYKE